MNRRHSSYAILAVLALATPACAAQIEPDWHAFEGSANEFVDAAHARGGFLGAGTATMSAEDPEPSDGDGITLEYAEDVRVDSVSVACFGDGAAQFGYVVRTGSSWVGQQAVEVVCDGGEQVLTPDRPIDGVNAIRLNGTLSDGSGAIMAAAVAGDGEPGEPNP